MDIIIRPGMSQTEIRNAETVANAAGRGNVIDAPLRIKFESGDYDLRMNSFVFRSPYREIDARGAVFKGTGIPKENAKFSAISDATKVICAGGTVVAADVANLTSRLGTSIQELHDMSFLEYDSWEDGLSCNNYEGDTLKASSRLGVPTKQEPWITSLNGCKFINWSGAVSTHPVYLHGRYGELHVNSCIFAGGRGSSALKTTRNVLSVRKSKFYSEIALLNGAVPVGGSRALNKLVDVPSCSSTIISDCEFHGAYHPEVGGLYYMVAIRTRRDLWSDDVDLSPADVHWERFTQAGPNPIIVPFVDTNVKIDGSVGVYAELNGNKLQTAPKPINGDNWQVTILPNEVPANGTYSLIIKASDTVKRPQCKPIRLTFVSTSTHRLVSSFINASVETLSKYLDESWWSNLGDLSSPTNPLTHKTWISNCKFVRHPTPQLSNRRGRGRIAGIWSFGAYPIEAKVQFSVQNRIHPVPRTWQDRSTVFTYENKFEGWLEGEEYMGVSSDGAYRPDYDLLHGINPPEPLNPSPKPRIIEVQPQVVTQMPSWFLK
jgi:hypothetical protein